MRKVLTLALSIAFIGVFGQAKISDLPATTTLTGVELFPVVQGGVTKKTTAAQIASLATASGTNYVPYSGATTSVNLGAQTFSTTGPVYGSNLWYNNGNTVATNTAYIGTNDNSSLYTVINGSFVAKADTTAKFHFGYPIQTNTTSFGDFRIRQGNSFVDIGERSNLNPCIWFSNTNSPNNNTSSNWAISGGTISTVINGPLTSIDLRVQAANIFVIRGTSTVGATIPYDYLGPNNTGQTASTEIPTLKLTPGGRQWSSGNISLQREYYFRANPLSATATSSITNVYGVYAEPPTASTNMSFGNSWGLGTNSNAHITGSLVTGSSAHTPSASLDVTGGAYITSTLNLGGAALTGGNTGTAAVLSDAVYNFNCLGTVGSMADATTYYFGSVPMGLQTASVSPILIPYNSTLIGYCANFVINGGAATSENATLSIVVDGVSTSLNSAIKMNAGTGINTYTSTALSQDINAGSVINAKLLTPTWSTNPGSTVTSIIFYFVRRK